jgi:RNA polymerase sporulation-specific sigma factor
VFEVSNNKPDTGVPSSEFATQYDETLKKAQQGDNRALELIIERYKGVVRAKSRTYFLIGADREDLLQEGMIGLYKAIRDYNPNKHSTFKAFAELCITRQIITAIKTATRQKHTPLNSYISLNKAIFDDESSDNKTLLDMLGKTSVNDPEELMINRENLSGIKDKMKEVLSSLERSVLGLYLQGDTYNEISEKIGRHVKSIDNALQRVKRKLEKYLEEEKI